MVNSASASLAEFKSQRMGGLLSGFSSTVSAPSIVGTSLSDSASSRLARSAPKKSSTAFMDGIRQSGQRLHQTAMQGAAQRQAAAGGTGGAAAGMGGLPGVNKGVKYTEATAGRAANNTGMTGGGGSKGGFGGLFGLQSGASAALVQLNNAYKKAWGADFQINDGYRDYQNQVIAYNRYLAGGPQAAKPGGSIHGKGIAVDLGGPIQNSGSKQHAWLRQNAAAYGWYWVGKRYGEPWHWEYRPEGAR